MDSIALLRSMVKNAHDTMEGTMADVTPEQAHWLPGGKALPIGALYAHTVGGEDAILSMYLKKITPLFAASWAGKTGMSELMPPSAPWDEWGCKVKVDLTAMREYAKAVYAATDEYLSTLKIEDLDTSVEFGGMGTWKLGDILGMMLVGHVGNHCGEISCLKGLQGAKGYPF